VAQPGCTGQSLRRAFRSGRPRRPADGSRKTGGIAQSIAASSIAGLLKTARNLCALAFPLLGDRAVRGQQPRRELLGRLNPPGPRWLLWCLDDSRRAGVTTGRDRAVPACIYWLLANSDRIDSAAGRMEELLGTPSTGAAAEPAKRRYGRLIHLAKQLLWPDWKAFYCSPSARPTDQPQGDRTPRAAEEPAFQVQDRCRLRSGRAG